MIKESDEESGNLHLNWRCIRAWPFGEKYGLNTAFNGKLISGLSLPSINGASDHGEKLGWFDIKRMIHGPLPWSHHHIFFFHHPPRWQNQSKTSCWLRWLPLHRLFYELIICGSRREIWTQFSLVSFLTFSVGIGKWVLLGEQILGKHRSEIYPIFFINISLLWFAVCSTGIARTVTSGRKAIQVNIFHFILPKEERYINYVYFISICKAPFGIA